LGFRNREFGDGFEGLVNIHGFRVWVWILETWNSGTDSRVW